MVITSMLEKVTALPPVPKPPARLLAANSWCLIFLPVPIQPMCQAVMCLVVLLEQGMFRCTLRQSLVITSTLEKLVASPPVPKPLALLLVVNSWCLIFLPVPIHPMCLAVMCLVVLLEQLVLWCTLW